ncbi:aminotransferase class V-fold PLP-dependent enzyme [Shouchella shacheensis]|uniref:aminotransferase class V-fold PLP-dependent enzyme n=1 Tax=Shouchella shacheensis TaxID=1649580 RepID=UPI00073FC833|nr:aminotransferase class V-fold PLP-dependent enzyme [Shouchella shacheensis]
MYYFDHAASSFPKPKTVSEAMAKAVDEYGANPGRSGHALARSAGMVVEETRGAIARMFNAAHPRHVWFYQNATQALNQALLGFPLSAGDHVIATAFEHNSVIRPLKQLEKTKGVRVTYVEPDEAGLIRSEQVSSAMTANTKAIVANHASNVTGVMLPLRAVSEIAAEKGAFFIVDASQTAGAVDIDIERDGIDLLAFAGHKGLLGPQGTGVLVSRRDVGLTPLIHGGTGHLSELDEQPGEWPERYEAGTLNTPGIAGLGAGVAEIRRLGIETIHEGEAKRTKQFLKGLNQMETVRVIGPRSEKERVAVVAFSFAGISSQEVAMILDEHYQMAVRAGLHCAPRLHQHYGTADAGLVRVSFGPYTTEEEVEALLDALAAIDAAFPL